MNDLVTTLPVQDVFWENEFLVHFMNGKNLYSTYVLFHLKRLRQISIVGLGKKLRRTPFLSVISPAFECKHQTDPSFTYNSNLPMSSNLLENKIDHPQRLWWQIRFIN